MTLLVLVFVTMEVGPYRCDSSSQIDSGGTGILSRPINTNDMMLVRGRLGSWKFKSKSHRDEYSPEGHCKAEMFALLVTEQLDSWPEQNARHRQWGISVDTSCFICSFSLPLPLVWGIIPFVLIFALVIKEVFSIYTLVLNGLIPGQCYSHMRSVLSPESKLTITEARERCRYVWMQEALDVCVATYTRLPSEVSQPVSPNGSSELSDEEQS
eukprot:Gb_07969 [translate_table: standard]